MRRFFVVLLVVLTFSTSAASALTIDLENATLDELIQARADIEQAITENKDFKTFQVPIGEYVVGQHFPSGEYSITCEDYAGFLVYKGSTPESGLICNYGIDIDNPIGRLVLNDGQYVKVLNKLTFAPFIGLDIS